MKSTKVKKIKWCVVTASYALQREAISRLKFKVKINHLLKLKIKIKNLLLGENIRKQYQLINFFAPYLENVFLDNN